jgi:hypothetical protein
MVDLLIEDIDKIKSTSVLPGVSTDNGNKTNRKANSHRSKCDCQEKSEPLARKKLSH